ncbi:MAG: hypothetical protein IT266_08790 [Saprospiraceae bacterium]|nr:hypothetical protein [Saprospiraceae bacterium]
MDTRTLISGLLGGIVYWLLGALFYAFLLGKLLESLSGSATGVSRAPEEMVWWSLVLGNLFMGLGLAYILNNWAKISTLLAGAKAGALIGLLLTLGFDLIWFSSTNLIQLPGVFLDVATFTVMSALSGAVIGWWLGRSARA